MLPIVITLAVINVENSDTQVGLRFPPLVLAFPSDAGTHSLSRRSGEFRQIMAPEKYYD